MNIPDNLKVGGFNYTVLKDYKFKERTDLIGQTDHMTLQIKLQDCDTNGDNLPESKREEIFCHELLHCIDNIYNSNKLDEDMITRLAFGLHQVLKDNNLLK